MGLGAEFARQLAARKCNLLLTARSVDKLEALAAELKSKHGIECVVIPSDLAQPGAAKALSDAIAARGLEVEWLINNAGFGDAGDFIDMPPDRITGTLMVNVVALVELCRLLAPGMAKVKGARIINVASTAAFQPVPYFAAYAATKSFVLSFTEALSEELAPLGIRVLALCPGPTATNFSSNRGLSPEIFKRGQTAAQVVAMGIAASDAGSVVRVTTRQLPIFLMRFAPRAVVRKAAAKIARSMFQK